MPLILGVMRDIYHFGHKILFHRKSKLFLRYLQDYDFSFIFHFIPNFCSSFERGNLIMNDIDSKS